MHGYTVHHALPTVNEDILIYFVTHCAKNLNLAHGTIKTYLCGIRNMYIQAGYHNPMLATSGQPLFQLSLVLRGIKKSQTQTTNPRMPITTDILLALFRLLDGTFFSRHIDLLLRATCSMAFFGFLRCGEFTTPTKTFDPASHLSPGPDHSLPRSHPHRSPLAASCLKNWPLPLRTYHPPPPPGQPSVPRISHHPLPGCSQHSQSSPWFPTAAHAWQLGPQPDCFPWLAATRPGCTGHWQQTLQRPFIPHWCSFLRSSQQNPWPPDSTLRSLGQSMLQDLHPDCQRRREGCPVLHGLLQTFHFHTVNFSSTLLLVHTDTGLLPRYPTPGSVTAKRTPSGLLASCTWLLLMTAALT